ncbi:MAG TPA: prolyl oligopeptidase family serine peptidase [Candidatus Koribacter sp.]
MIHIDRNAVRRVIVSFIYSVLLMAVFHPGQIFAAGEAMKPEALVKQVETYPYEGIMPSPDGKWVAFETDDPTKNIRFDYENQRYTKSGYPMLASASATNVWVVEVATGKSVQMNTATGFSWSPNWSPDSTQLAFYSDRNGQAAVWVWDRRTGAARQISPAPVFFSWWKEKPLWSADGKTILTKLLPEGMTLTQVLSLSPYYAALINGGKDKKADGPDTAPTVHVYAFHPADKAKANAAQAPETDSFSSFYDAMFLSDLTRIDVATGKATRLVKHIRLSWFGYSPDGKMVGYTTMNGVVPKTQQFTFGVHVYDVASGASKDLALGYADPNNLNSGVSWSPDSKHLSYVDDGKTMERAAWVIDISTGAKVKVSDPLDKESRTFDWGAALWDKSGANLFLLDPEVGRLWEVAADGSKGHEVVTIPGAKIKDIAAMEMQGTYWSPDDGKTMYVRAHDSDTKKDAIYAVNLEAGSAKKVYEGNESMAMREAGALTGLPGSNTVVYSSESASSADEVWALDVNNGEARKLSKLNSQFESASMGKIRIIDFMSLHNEHLHGALLLPGDYQEGKRYPLVVWVYGGDYGSDKVNRFGFGWGGCFNFQMLASRGYAVLYPDVPLHPGTPVDDLVSAVIPAINKTVELGVADPDRLALMGQSFGGYNTVALLTRTTIFKAAVATSAAPVDLFMGYSAFLNGTSGGEGYYEEGQGGMKGDPWDLKERYWENSPMFFLEKIQTPLMLESGGADSVCSQCGNIFNGLKRLGKDVEYLEYDHEGHVIQEPVNIIDFWNRRIAWLDRYLGSSAGSASSAAGQ